MAEQLIAMTHIDHQGAATQHRSCSLVVSVLPQGECHSARGMADFRKLFAKANHIVIISGAGISAESGIPTFRGAGGYWRKWQAQTLATPEAFAQNPSLVWEFYHYRREVIQRVKPNPGHLAIAECEARLREQGRRVMVITQNIDELHRKAGTKNLLEIHGSIFKTQCTSCGVVAENYKSPICEAFAGKGAPEPETQDARIPMEKLPRCEEAGCGGLLRPYVVWFGENLDSAILEEVDKELALCDLCLVPCPPANQSDYMQINPTKMAAGSHRAGASRRLGCPNDGGSQTSCGGSELHSEQQSFNYRRDKTLLKEKRKRREELFIEQKKRKLLPDTVLEKLTAASQTDIKKSPGKLKEDNLQKKNEECEKGSESKKVKEKVQSIGQNKSYVARRLKDQDLRDSRQQAAIAFIQNSLYGPGTNRTTVNKFLSLNNKRLPVKKAAVQFLNNGWGTQKKQNAKRFKRRWMVRKMKTSKK
ncbi:NAD-dependent deacetylase sirtuin-5 [Myotis davidii]|uniref:NAD-dependent protein deacylase sirtuin-5, mitochondrial n=1 Tax=Myotis davidii TaxID=225400 RepID=L5LI25_MYODS|nr:NAD-dependent deacetylase sirtuin-5 [Myotis davidii]